MRLNAKICASMILATCAGACGGSDDGKSSDESTKTPNSSAKHSSKTEPAGAAGAASSTSTSSARNGKPTNTDSSSPAANPGRSIPTMGADGARFPDACSERRASWSTPCSQDPDPCNLKSGYPGDEYCLLPPPEGKGIQIHFGPKNYKDMAEVAKYIINPGEEFNTYAVANVPDFGTQTKYFQYIKISMRPGSHHLINNLISGHPPEGFVAGRAGCEGGSMGSFQGTQNLITESPPQGIPAPENEGLGRTLPPNVSICQNYHRYNTTDQKMISEI